MIIPAIFERGVFRPLQPVDLPEGSPVRVEAGFDPTPAEGGLLRDRPEPDWAAIAAAEACQPDDPAACAVWGKELLALPPVPMTEEEAVDWLEWRRRMKEFNLQAFFAPSDLETA